MYKKFNYNNQIVYIFLLILQRDKIFDIQVYQVCEGMDPLIYFLWASQIFQPFLQYMLKSLYMIFKDLDHKSLLLETPSNV